MSELAVILIAVLGVSPMLAALAIGLIVILDDADVPIWVGIPLIYVVVVGLAFGAGFGLEALQ